ncbi:MAG: response regulator [Bacteroidales bacterium]|nr:response regulator [Bacteroidales bacterium]
MKKILAIDDNKDNLTSIEAVIKNNIPGCKVFTALSGKEGIKIATEQQPDTILLDIIMPQMDGFEVCKKLKENESTKHIPIVMLTAIKTDSKSRIKALNTGADAFLSKPIDPIELSAQVNVMLRIKEAEDRLRAEKKVLEELVLERTSELKESEIKYKALYNYAPLPYQSLNEVGDFKDVNPAWLKTLGYERKEVVGKMFKDFLHPDWKKHFEKKFTEFKQQGFIHNVQYKIKQKEGHYLDVLFEGRIGYYPNGSFKQTYCVFQDITERKRAEQIQNILYNISNAVLTTDSLEKFIKLIQKELGTIINTN